LSLPACEAVSVQTPVPLLMVTVLPDIVHAPAGVTATARPELAVGATANEVLYTAGLTGAGKVIVWSALFTCKVPGAELAAKFPWAA